MLRSWKQRKLHIAHNCQKKKGKILESMKGASLEFTQKLVSHI